MLVFGARTLKGVPQYDRMNLVAHGEKRDIITFEAGYSRKKAARMLALLLDYHDVSAMLKDWLDEKIAEKLPQLMDQIEEEDPKARSRRQAKRKAG